MKAKNRTRVLLIDDEHQLANAVSEMLEVEGFRADIANDADQAKALLANHIYDIAIIDLRMPDTDGLLLIEYCRKIDPGVAVIMLTAHQDFDAVKKAFKLGAKDFLLKPVKRGTLVDAIDTALESSRDDRCYRALQRQAARSSNYFFLDSLHTSNALQRAIDAIETQRLVVIQGETGTGKMELARAIHMKTRPDGPFVHAVTKHKPIQEENLFGNITSGPEPRIYRGLFAEADRGTIVIDKVANLSLSDQRRIVDAANGKSRAVGAATDLQLDVTVICLARVTAETNSNGLCSELADGPFLTVDLLPLRERCDDIEMLVDYFLQQFTNQEERLSIDADCLSVMNTYTWPGNVRELRNVVEQAVKSRGDAAAVIENYLPGTLFDLPLEEAKKSFISNYLLLQLRRYGYDISKVAEHAGVHPASIRRKIRELGIVR